MIPTRPAMDAGLIVRSLERTVPFYRDALGLAVVGERTTGWGSMVEFGFGQSVLRLLQPIVEPESSAPGMLSSTGFRYLTLPVVDFDGCLARALDWGAPQTLETLRAGAVRFAMVSDPEGNLIEFFGRDA